MDNDKYKYKYKYDICFYHKPCSDGLASCWAVSKYCDSVMCIGMSPQFVFDIGRLNLCKGGHIICVDVIPNKETLDALDGICSSLTILDHHKTNKEILDDTEWTQSLLIKIFDMNRAGCQITWDYLFTGIDRPWFIDYIADRDLWKWELSDSKAINAGLYELKYNTLDRLDELYNNNKEAVYQILKQSGLDKQEFDDKVINQYIDKAFICYLHIPDGTKQLIILGNPPPEYRSEFGNKCLLANPTHNIEIINISACWHLDFISQEWWISLRSLTPANDVSAIAKQFGGGGHPCASGFTIKRSDGKDIWDYFTMVE